jgi:hypothetical protein
MGPPTAIEALVEASLADQMVLRQVRLASPDVVFFKSIVEANNGLAQVFAQPASESSKRLDRADRMSDLSVVAAADSEAELDQLLADLASEIELQVVA